MPLSQHQHISYCQQVSRFLIALQKDDPDFPDDESKYLQKDLLIILSPVFCPVPILDFLTQRAQRWACICKALPGDILKVWTSD